MFVLAGATDMLDIDERAQFATDERGRQPLPWRSVRRETEQLVAEVLGRHLTPGQRKTFQTLHDWTAGHPYWTQLLERRSGRRRTELPETAIKAVVEQLLQTEDRNLPHVFRALEADGGLWDLSGRSSSARRSLYAGEPGHRQARTDRAPQER